MFSPPGTVKVGGSKSEKREGQKVAGEKITRKSDPIKLKFVVHSYDDGRIVVESHDKNFNVELDPERGVLRQAADGQETVVDAAQQVRTKYAPPSPPKQQSSESSESGEGGDGGVPPLPPPLPANNGKTAKREAKTAAAATKTSKSADASGTRAGKKFRTKEERTLERKRKRFERERLREEKRKAKKSKAKTVQ
jgi:hypothetical protein